jgi:phosphatidylserine/phosphatidylglycerophosphate/cardiolipin synthase-like enzyme
LNEEANLVIDDPGLARLHRDSFARDRSVAREVTPVEWRDRPRYLKCLDAAAHLLRPML